MEDLPFDLSIQSVKHHPALALPSKKGPSSSGPDGPGISAMTALEESHCGVQSASGVFKLRRAWTRATSGGDFVELFEGYFTFNVSYSGLYKRAGHGSGERFEWSFWAIRARRGASGKEIGLRPISPVSVNVKAGVPVMHPTATPVAAQVCKDLSPLILSPSLTIYLSLPSLNRRELRPNSRVILTSTR